MCEVEPDGKEPNHVKNGVDDAAGGLAVESLRNPCESVGRTRANRITCKLSEHHVIPEVEQMEQQTEADDQSEHEHVLRRPLHLVGFVGHRIPVAAACLTVLKSQDDGIDEVDGDKRHQHHCRSHGIPVGAKEAADHVVAIS